MMHMHNELDRKTKSGSIILEIAITAPVFCLIAVFLLSGIVCLKAEVLFSQAIDQVTQEIAVGVPVAGGVIDLTESALELLNEASVSGTQNNSGNVVSDQATPSLLSALGGVDALFETIGIEVEDISATLLLGKGVRDRIVATFYSYLPNDDLVHERIQNVSVYLDYDEARKVIWIRVYYEWNTIFGSVDKMIESAVPIYGDLQLSLPDTNQDQTAADKLWSLSNFERGLSIRTTFGANLPATYPVIATWNSGQATAIKSIDLTAPGYAVSGELTKNVQGFISELSSFSGTKSPWGASEITISEDMISSRTLVIVIPDNAPDSVYSELLACESYARAQGISLNIEEYGHSYRYEEQENESDIEQLTS
jgi:hypothetical protein